MIEEAVEFVGGTLVGQIGRISWAWREYRGREHYIFDDEKLYKLHPQLHPSRWVGSKPCVGYKQSVTLTEICVAQSNYEDN